MNGPNIDGEKELLRPRSYQIEMLEESMKQNVIIAMDTGSGKTHVAILRIQEELKRCSPDQICWFLAPKVALCEQQHLVLKRHLPGYGHRMLCGADGVDKWSTRAIWDAALKNIQIVCSTPQVLLDCLTHGFVKLKTIALLVIDEAHGAISDSPARTIMADFYFKTAVRPQILALTASPVMQASGASMKTIESNLDAPIRTPKKHRSELERHANRAVTQAVQYPPFPSPGPTAMLNRLECALETYEVIKDPFVLDLLESSNEVDRERLHKVIAKRKTYCIEQLKGLTKRAFDICTDVGPQLAEWYILECTSKLRSSADASDSYLIGWTNKEKQHLLRILDGIAAPPLDDSDPADHGSREKGYSPKAEKLLEILSQSSSKRLTGIIFAQQRAVVSALARFLSNHPATAHLRIGSFVGASNQLARAGNITDLANRDVQQRALLSFRESCLDLLVSTDVLSEGIDVPAANIVICFDPPQNLVSFIQRRGRARQKESKYFIMMPEGEGNMRQWSAQEEQMVQMYLAEDEAVRKELKDEYEGIGEDRGREFRVESTGALLTHQNASSHLHHLTQTLSNQKPHFSLVAVPSAEPRAKLHAAKAILPLAIIDPALRTAYSAGSWHSEKAAKRDAAFVACQKLYHAGLLNEHLLPLLSDVDEEEESVEKKATIAEVAGRLNPWDEVATAWDICECVKVVTLTLRGHSGEAASKIEMMLPEGFCFFDGGKLYWDEDTTYTVDVGPRRTVEKSEELCNDVGRTTLALLRVAHRTRMDGNRTDFVAFFTPTPDSGISVEDLERSVPAGDISSVEHFSHETSPIERGYALVRDVTNPDATYIFRGLSVNIPTIPRKDVPPDEDHEPQPQPCIAATKLPRRKDFLHPIPTSNKHSHNQARGGIHHIPLLNSRITQIPPACITLSHFLPSILHLQEVTLVASLLNSTLLAPVRIHNLDLIRTAICASSAGEPVNYQRQEFLGDCILKVLVSLQLMVRHPEWPEGYLTRRKGQLVSNQSLTGAALKRGLAQFVVTRRFTGAKWRPLYRREAVEGSELERRDLSSKVLADVVEALIGAAYIDGASGAEGSGAMSDASGLEKALKCLRIFFPDMQWDSYADLVQRMQALSTAQDTVAHTHLSDPEQLVGHSFTSKAVLASALTHPSYSSDLSGQCYQRLEFLGDALLDYIVTVSLFSNSTIPHQRLHTYRTALVSADFLALLLMDNNIPIEMEEIVPSAVAPSNSDAAGPSRSTHDLGRSFRFTPRPYHERRALWQYMQHSHSLEMARALSQITATHAELRDPLVASLRSGDRYPWASLAGLQAPKFMSDLVESCIGALFVDSGGDLNGCCRNLLSKLGIMDYAERLMKGEVWALHPKEEIGMLVGRMEEEFGSVRYEIGRQAADVEVRNAEDGLWSEEAVLPSDVDDRQDGLECRLFVGEVQVGHASGGRSRNETETKAAEDAVLAWNTEGGGLARVMGNLRTLIEDKKSPAAEVNTNIDIKAADDEESDD